MINLCNEKMRGKGITLTRKFHFLDNFFVVNLY